MFRLRTRVTAWLALALLVAAIVVMLLARFKIKEGEHAPVDVTFTEQLVEFAGSATESTYFMLRVQGTGRLPYDMFLDYRAESLGTWLIIDTADSTYTLWLKRGARLRLKLDYSEGVRL